MKAPPPKISKAAAASQQHAISKASGKKGSKVGSKPDPVGKRSKKQEATTASKKRKCAPAVGDEPVQWHKVLPSYEEKPEGEDGEEEGGEEEKPEHDPVGESDAEDDRAHLAPAHIRKPASTRVLPNSFGASSGGAKPSSPVQAAASQKALEAPHVQSLRQQQQDTVDGLERTSPSLEASAAAAASPSR